RVRDREHVDLERAHELASHATKEDALAAGEPARPDDEEVGARALDQPGDRCRAGPLDDPRAVAHTVEIEPLDEARELLTSFVELALSFLAHAVGLDPGVGEHLAKD